MELFIGIATCGRKALLNRVVADIARQTVLPDRIFIAPIDRERDVGELDLPATIRDSVIVLEGPAGSAAQRNTILGALEGSQGIVLFIDDDFILHEDYCQELKALFLNNSNIVGVAGKVLADGINSPGIDFNAAAEIITAHQLLEKESLRDNGTTYGCNMSFRLETIFEFGIRFDEMLPLYGWFEDLDFSAQLAKYGRVVGANRCVGVHLGHKSGRTSGIRLGYSQVVNPLYLWKKGTMSLKDALVNVSRRVMANLLRSIRPEAWVDRKGRLNGNILGLKDVLKGTADPRRILEM